MKNGMGKRNARKARTRVALKEAARACLEETSFPELQITGITSRAGVAVGTFYVHFPNKESLLDELIAEFNIRQTERLAAVWAGGVSDPETIVSEVAGTLLDAWMSERDLLEAFVRRSATGSSLATLRDGINPPMAEFLFRALEAWAAGRGGRVPHLELATQAVLGLWMRVALQYLFNPEVTREAAVETLTTMTLGAASAVVVPGGRGDA